MIYEPDDMIGMGDLKSAIAKMRKGARKFKSWIKRVRGKGKKAVARVSAAASRVAEATQRPSSDPGAVVVEPSPGPGAGLLRNPLLIGGVAVAALLLLTGRKRG